MLRRRVTQQDVANKAGVTRATVSLALKSHPSIPAKTRTRIMRLAAKLGYAPDPMLSALAAYRSRHRPATFHGTLAWLVNSSFGYNWRRVRQFSDYHAGAMARARRHGFQVEIYDLNQPSMTTERIAAILRARNIAGLLLCPQPRPDTSLEFPWEDFSAVTFGYTLATPHLHTVTSTQYRDMQITMRNVRARGYQRIGLALSRDHDLRTDHNYLAGYLVDEQQTPRPHSLPVLGAAYTDADALKRWLRRYRPDALVACGGLEFFDTMQRVGPRIPDDLGLAFPNLAQADSRLAGVVEDSTEIGAVAVDFLVAMMHRGERGIPGRPQRIHVEGQWTDGKSLGRLAAM